MEVLEFNVCSSSKQAGGRLHSQIMCFSALKSEGYQFLLKTLEFSLWTSMKDGNSMASWKGTSATFVLSSVIHPVTHQLFPKLLQSSHGSFKT